MGRSDGEEQWGGVIGTSMPVSAFVVLWCDCRGLSRTVLYYAVLCCAVLYRLSSTHRLILNLVLLMCLNSAWPACTSHDSPCGRIALMMWPTAVDFGCCGNIKVPAAWTEKL